MLLLAPTRAPVPRALGGAAYRTLARAPAQAQMASGGRDRIALATLPG